MADCGNASKVICSTLGNSNSSQQKRKPYQLALEGGFGDIVKEQNGPQRQAEQGDGGPGGEPSANCPVARNQERGKKGQADETEVDVNLEVAVVSFIDPAPAKRLQDEGEARTEPEALVAGAKERISVHAEEDLPQIGSTGEVGVAADHAGDLSINPETKLQNRVGAESDRN